MRVTGNRKDCSLSFNAKNTSDNTRIMTDINETGEEIAYDSDWSTNTDEIYTATGYNPNAAPITTTKRLPLGSTKCLVCNKQFKRRLNLISHMIVHYPPFLCHICGKTCAIASKLKRHLETHLNTEKQLKTHTCNICLKDFRTQNLLKCHQAKLHQGIKNLKCLICKERFNSFEEKMDHMKGVHNLEYLMFSCKKCTKQFDTRTKLLQHVKRCHLKQKDYKCNQCTEAFFVPSDLKDHTAAVHSDFHDIGPSWTERTNDENPSESMFDDEHQVLDDESKLNNVIFLDPEESDFREVPGPHMGPPGHQNITGSNMNTTLAGAEAPPPEWMRQRTPTIGANERTSPTSRLYFTYEETQRERSKIEKINLGAAEEQRLASKEIHELKKQILQGKIQLLKHLEEAAILDIEIKKLRMRSK